IFQEGDRVSITGTSKGRGFTGVVKRHGFHGGPKTHGQSDRHRAPGSIGSSATPGRVLKGTRMAGHSGNAQVTVKNLRVVRSDPERNLLTVEGAVPGAASGLVVVRRSGDQEG
ncbi:MAG: 50S ribosomal protein L3, partial [Chloroflexota bacterium]